MHLLFCVLTISILLFLCWSVAEFKVKKSWIRFVLGVFTLASWLILLDLAIPLFNVCEKFNYNAHYGSASKQLIDTIIEKIEKRETEKILECLKKLQKEFHPSYENRANYDELINEAVKGMKETKHKSFHNVCNPIFYPDDKNIEKYLALRDKADLSIYLNSIDNISLTVKGNMAKKRYDIKSLKKYLHERARSEKLVYIFYCKRAHWDRDIKPEIESWKSYFSQRGFDRLIIQLATSKKGVYILLDMKFAVPPKI